MALDGEVRRSLLDRTDAEKAFRPWWDTLEDTLLNTLIALGKSFLALISHRALCLIFRLSDTPHGLRHRKSC